MSHLESDFMYYPDIDSENFYTNIWKKKEFYDTKSHEREFYDNPAQKKELLRRLCATDIIKLQNHQIFFVYL